jgi:hypothetical protein
MAGVPIQNLALSVVSNLAMARASSLFNVTRQIFAAVGVAGLSAYLTNRATAIAPQVVVQARAGVGAAGDCVQATPQSAGAIRECLTRLVTSQSLNDAFAVVVVLCFVTMLICILLGRDPAVGAAAHAQRHEREQERVALEA